LSLQHISMISRKSLRSKTRQVWPLRVQLCYIERGFIKKECISSSKENIPWVRKDISVYSLTFENKNKSWKIKISALKHSKASRDSNCHILHILVCQQDKENQYQSIFYMHIQLVVLTDKSSRMDKLSRLLPLSKHVNSSVKKLMPQWNSEYCGFGLSDCWYFTLSSKIFFNNTGPFRLFRPVGLHPKEMAPCLTSKNDFKYLYICLSINRK